MLVLGAGLLPLLRLARTRRELLLRLPLAYAVGLAATGILAADLAVVDVPVGIGSCSPCYRGVGRGRAQAPAGRRRARPAFHAAAVRRSCVPRARRRGGLRGAAREAAGGQSAERNRRLGDLGPAGAGALRLWPPGRAHLTDPPTRPCSIHCCCRGSRHSTSVSWAASTARSSTCKLLGFAVAFVGGAWGLLRDRVPRLLLAAVLLAAVTAPTA